jgi:hypothetical protein
MSKYTSNDWIKDVSVNAAVIDGLECFVVPSPMMRIPFTRSGGWGPRIDAGYNGYVVFPERPVKQSGYGGLLVYVPVHGGITYAEEDEVGCVYGFDTGHFDSGSFPNKEIPWILSQCEVMIRGIRLAAILEDAYLLAEGDNETRLEICQQFQDLQPSQSKNFMVCVNLLAGNL